MKTKPIMPGDVAALWDSLRPGDVLLVHPACLKEFTLLDRPSLAQQIEDAAARALMAAQREMAEAFPPR